jgi:hypothetical protein
VRVVHAGAGLIACALVTLAGLLAPLADGTGAAAATTPTASPTASPSPRAARTPSLTPGRPLGPAAVLPVVTRITVDGNDGGPVYDGAGAVLGGGGNARYLMDYPVAKRDQILDYLFKPGYGAALQLLKLEIGGDANSSDGAEPSIEHTKGHVNCRAGYEFSIARAAVALNPAIRLYGLQWAAPGWVGTGTGAKELFTDRDISYLLSWLGCARSQGLTISYLGGWNESDRGNHQAWFRQLRQTLNDRGYRRVQIVAGDSWAANGAAWPYVGDRDVAILGAHDDCDYPTGAAGPGTACTSPWSEDGHTGPPGGQPMWASELGGMDAGAQRGCRVPCAPAMDRAVIRGFVDARLTGFLEWPVLDAMPSGLPFENRGLVTADQPWAGSYHVDAMTWAIAQLTQFVQPPSANGRVSWRYLVSGSGLLNGHAADGSYVSLVRGGGTAWSSIIEATTAKSAQTAEFHVTGGSDLARRTVHVWASNFNRNGGPGQWFVRQPDIKPSAGGRFSLVIRPGWVYSLTTTTGQGKGTATGQPAAALPLPLSESLATSGSAGSADDEPPYLAAQDGAFELAPCWVPDRGDRTCTEQEAAASPVFWHGTGTADTHFPYATIGAQDWSNYQVSVDVLLPAQGGSAGLIGRFGCRRAVPDVGQFDGYLFSVSATGTWRLIQNANADGNVGDGSSACPAGPAALRTLASGRLAKPLRTGTWYRLTLAMSGSRITAAIGGTTLASVSDPAWTAGSAGIETGALTTSWPHVQFSHLTVTPLGSGGRG